MVAHVSPEAARGGPLALVEDGDEITIDVTAHTLSLNVHADELEMRRSRWSAPPPRYRSGIFARYAAEVGSASEGAVL